jgi:phenazine biosynthesis protein phzE
MGAAQLRALGFDVRVRRFDDAYDLRDAELVLLGPGPGDPRDGADPKIAHLRALTASLLNLGLPFVSVCLSHQVLCAVLGLPLRRLATAQQGVRRTIELAGRAEPVYFYNAFAAYDDGGRRPDGVRVTRDAATGEVHALRGPGFASVQFHPESVLTRNGVRILDELVTGALRPGPAAFAA